MKKYVMPNVSSVRARAVFVLTLVISSISQAHWAALNEFEADRISRAKTQSELDSWSAKFQALRVDIVACELQKNQGVAPTRCYAARLKTKDWPIEWPTENSAEELARECLSIAQHTKQTEVPDIGLLPADCAHKVRQTVELNKYKASGPEWRSREPKIRHDF